jgi:hypothetical protein
MKTSNYPRKYEIPCMVFSAIEPKTKADVDKMEWL